MPVLSKKELNKMNKYFRALNYLSVAQLYLLDNPLVRRGLVITDIKPNVVGHWGTAPGQNFIYMHLNRIIKKYDLKMIYLSGPGHGGQAMIANNYLEGVYTKFYPEITEDEAGLKKLCKQFSFPGGVSSHVAPETPGSIHEGGELGYSLAHAAGAVLDNPDLIAACVVGDGEAETGPLATSWNINKFLNFKNDGVVLPILHRNGYKIANPTIFGRMSEEEMEDFFYGLSWKPYFVSGSDPMRMHEKMAEILDKVVKDIKKIKKTGVGNYPVIVLTTPKGWTGPKEIDLKKIEGSFRSHQVPVAITRDKQENIKILEKWLLSYHPEELFDSNGRLVKELRDLCPTPSKCMGNSPYANGGLLLKDIITPNWQDYAVEVKAPGSIILQDTMELGKYIRDVFSLNKENKNFRIFGPDEALSNRFNHIFEVENRTWNFKKIRPDDEFLSNTGRVMDSYLSEHLCQGMLEGYLLTGRYGFIHSYEAFVRIVDSMASQHAKWLKVCNQIPWRAPIASLNYLLVSHVFQQDHNGYTHQDPGFLNHLVTKKADVIRMYLPPDTNCLLSCFEHCIKTKNYVNVIVASKHPRPQWLTKEQAKIHCTKGLGVWDFASNDCGNPDVIMACCGETPTLETLAAVDILRKTVKGIKIRVVNVVDLMKLQSPETHPHGMSDQEYDTIFTKDKPIIFNFHGYPSLIHQLTYKRHNRNMHVHGYKEEGTITTTFDIRVQNEIDRFNLVIAALKEIPRYKDVSKALVDWCLDMLKKHKDYIHEYGEDMPYIQNWKWDIK
ncbi:MAG: phosphoketolase family protein [Tenericutes bacterium]|nr:phosphoketolase family protein [Mycoplasmatota bacterium]MDD6941117.1 phosphoketolase family protein [bacterium]MDY2697005.1 phosphoketolase family protein [Bacilli bacterium]